MVEDKMQRGRESTEHLSHWREFRPYSQEVAGRDRGTVARESFACDSISKYSDHASSKEIYHEVSGFTVIIWEEINFFRECYVGPGCVTRSGFYEETCRHLKDFGSLLPLGTKTLVVRPLHGSAHSRSFSALGCRFTACWNSLMH
uniref:Cyclic nucleotide-gated calmodulin-binding ion channel n=1 Tax=Solanum tuberosum TaxID=4113 RepID=M1AID0_SOLTU